jgi:hypothetical protein
VVDNAGKAQLDDSFEELDDSPEKEKIVREKKEEGSEEDEAEEYDAYLAKLEEET